MVGMVSILTSLCHTVKPLTWISREVKNSLIILGFKCKVRWLHWLGLLAKVAGSMCCGMERRGGGGDQGSKIPFESKSPMTEGLPDRTRWSQPRCPGLLLMAYLARGWGCITYDHRKGHLLLKNTKSTPANLRLDHERKQTHSFTLKKKNKTKKPKP